MILIVATAVAALNIVRQASSDAFRALERIESRHEKSLQTVLDRLMTVRWEDFVAVQSTADDDVGGFIAPTEQRNEGQEDRDEDLRQIFTLRGLKPPSNDELALLEEDFPSEMGGDK